MLRLFRHKSRLQLSFHVIIKTIRVISFTGYCPGKVTKGLFLAKMGVQQQKVVINQSLRQASFKVSAENKEVWHLLTNLYLLKCSKQVTPCQMFQQIDFEKIDPRFLSLSGNMKVSSSRGYWASIDITMGLHLHTTYFIRKSYLEYLDCRGIYSSHKLGLSGSHLTGLRACNNLLLWQAKCRLQIIEKAKTEKMKGIQVYH